MKVWMKAFGLAIVSVLGVAGYVAAIYGCVQHPNVGLILCSAFVVGIATWMWKVKLSE